MAARHGYIHRAIERRLHRSPRAIRAVARVGALAQRLGLPVATLDPQTLLEEARRQTGLSDFGDDWFMEPLQILISSYHQTVGRTFMGQLTLRSEIVRLLANRLLIQRDLELHPEILDVPIRRPLFIIGFPRCGTTLLHNLLALDPQARHPRVWELLRPSPPPERDSGDSDPRIRDAEDDLRIFGSVLPGMSAIHHVDARAPEECIALLQHTFATPYYTLATHIGPYWDWFLQADLAPAYRYHRRLLQLLLWRWPGDYWVLKSPSHLVSLDALLTVYPDARVVHLHRDLGEVAASTCSLDASLARLYRSNELIHREFGATWMSLWSTILDRALAARAKAPDGTFLDVAYRDLTTDPIGTVHRIQHHFDLRADATMDARMHAWLAQNPQGKFGEHRYSLEQFGLNRQQLTERFADYHRRFAAELA